MDFLWHFSFKQTNGVS